MMLKISLTLCCFSLVSLCAAAGDGVDSTLPQESAPHDRTPDDRTPPASTLQEKISRPDASEMQGAARKQGTAKKKGAAKISSDETHERQKDLSQQGVSQKEDECTSIFPQLSSTFFTTMGIEGTYYLRHAGEPLKAQPSREGDPIRVRIADTMDDCGATIYELRYTSDVAGQIDLSKLLTGADGRPLNNLEPANVIVREFFEGDHNGQLEPLPVAPLMPPLRYKLLLVLLGTLWLVPALWYVLKLTASGS